MQTVNFNDCTQQDLMDWFGIRKCMTLPSLTDWLTVSGELTTSEIDYLTPLKKDMFYFADSWNEYELYGKIIGPVLSLGHLDGQRDMTADIGEIRLMGKVDGLLATGFQRPKRPFFCLNEYKKSFEFRGEPVGQCLAAMLVAQTINHNSNPVYGIYIVGRSWYFCVLKDKEYAASREFDTTEDDIFEIPKILKKLKTIVITSLASEKRGSV